MRRVLGVTALVVILSSAGFAQAQEGWGTNPPPENGTGGQTGGWGSTPESTPPPQGEQGGWSANQQNPQSNDTESPTQPATGWGSTSPTTNQPPATTQPAATTTAAEPAETELVGDAFRLEHRIYLGGHTHMSGAFLAAYDGVPEASNDAMSPWLNFSFMYTLSRLITLDIFMGFTVGSHSYVGNGEDTVTGHSEDGDKVTNFEFGLGPRLLFTLHSGDRTRLYTGAGLAVLIGFHNASRDAEAGDGGVCPGGTCGGWDAYGFALAAPIGFEYRFRNAPNLAISMELNFHLLFQNVGLRYEDPDDDTAVVSQADFNQITVGLGNPRQPGAIEFADILTFLTFGLHYML